MKDLRQVVLGVLAALLSSTIMLGSLSLSMLEGGVQVAFAPSPTFTRVADELPPATLLPGETATVAAATPFPSATFPPPPTACVPPPGWQPITVQPDASLEGLAQSYAVSAASLAEANCLITSSLLAGTILYVPPAPPPTLAPPTDPPPSETPPVETEPPVENVSPQPDPACGPPANWVRYIIRSGDTLYLLSQSVGASISQLQQANCMGNSTVLRAGASFWVPRLPTPVYPTATPIPPPTSTPVPTNSPTQPPPPTPLPPTPVPPTPTQAPDPTSLPPTPTEAPPPTEAPEPTQAPPPTEEPPPSQEISTPTAEPLEEPTPEPTPEPTSAPPEP